MQGAQVKQKTHQYCEPYRVASDCGIESVSVRIRYHEDGASIIVDEVFAEALYAKDFFEIPFDIVNADDLENIASFLQTEQRFPTVP